MPDKKASEETAAAALSLDDGFPGVQDGVDVFILMQQVLDLMQAHITSSGSGLVNLAESVSVSYPNSPIGAVQLTPTSGTNCDLVLFPKGTGSLLATLPDGTATGGNKRGNNVVDLQIIRDTADQVATGIFGTIAGGVANKTDGFASTVVGGATNQAVGASSFVGGGTSNIAGADKSVVVGGHSNVVDGASGTGNTISGGENNSIYAGIDNFIGGGIGNYAGGDDNTISGGTSNGTSGESATVAGGQGNTAVADYATVGGGNLNAASRDNSTVIGGHGNTATGKGSVVSGVYATARSTTGSKVHGGGTYASAPGTIGLGQERAVQLRNEVFYGDGGTEFELAADDPAGTADDAFIVLPNSCLFTFEAIVAAMTSGGGLGAAWKITGSVLAQGDASTANFVDATAPTPVLISGTAPAGWACRVEVVSGVLRFYAIADDTNYTRWLATVTINEILFA